MKRKLSFLILFIILGVLVLCLTSCFDGAESSSEYSATPDGDRLIYSGSPKETSNVIDNNTPATSMSTEGNSTETPIDTDAPVIENADNSAQNSGVHIHKYNVENASINYLKSEATCVETAIYYFSCECGARGDEAFSLHGDSYGECKIVECEEIPATCEEDGYTGLSYCEICGKTYSEQEVIPATGHTVVNDIGYSATCTSSGLTDGSHCSVCDLVLEEQTIIPVKSHNYTYATYTAPATCTECGATKGSKLEQKPIYIDLPSLPVIQYDLYYVTSCSYSTNWNGDGTYDVSVTFYFCNIDSRTVRGGVYATLGRFQPRDGTAPTLAPGSYGTCTVKYYDVPSGSYTLYIER